MMCVWIGFTVDVVFIIHRYVDHFLGVFGLIETLAFMGRTDLLPIYGLSWIGELVDLARRISGYIRGFSVIAYLFEHGLVVFFNGYIVWEIFEIIGFFVIVYVFFSDLNFVLVNYFIWCEFIW